MKGTTIKNYLEQVFSKVSNLEIAWKKIMEKKSHKGDFIIKDSGKEILIENACCFETPSKKN